MKKVLLTIGVFVLFLGGLAISANHPKTTEVTNVTLTTNKVNPVTLKNEVTEKKTIKRLEVPETDIILLSTEVNYATYVSVVNAINQKQKTSKEIYLLLDSPGGSVFDGAQIITAMEASKVPVNTVCIGLCASMAAMIHQHGVKRLMFDRAVLMFHPAAGGLRGSLEEMASQLQMVTRSVNKMDRYIAKRVGITEEEFKSQWLTQKWIDAEDSKNTNFSDGTVFIPLQLEMPVQASPFGNHARFKPFNVELTN